MQQLACVDDVATDGPEPEHHLYQGWAQFLLSETNSLVDVYAAALKRTQATYGDLVKPDEVLALMLQASSKQGPPRIA